MQVREACAGDATTLALCAALLLAEDGAPTETLREFCRMFSGELKSEEREAILEHMEEIRIDGHSVFKRERKDDALAFDFTMIQETKAEIVLGMMTRAMELRSGKPAEAPTCSMSKAAERISRAIGFTEAN